MKVLRRLSALAALLPLLGCASTPAASGSAASGAAPKKAIVLVEAKGPAPELERFVPRFLSAASDRGLGAIVDARLSGARLADVAVPGEVSAEFRKAWPGDVYLGVLLSACQVQRREGRVYDRQANVGTGAPVRVENVVVSYEADCPVTVSVVTAPGVPGKAIDVTGRNGTSEVSIRDTEAEAQAAEDAAERAVKKLVSTLR
ncbi:MAG TPA: hypothetical protein VKS23_04280 [Thermoanaerobaculia bacterium]|jgi:hypothetical protein|nr:hypothetical protein [Thermoanaerobaculia bacterium]